MLTFEIKGRRPISGEIAVNGSKNEVLKLLPACILVPDTIELTNVPNIEAVHVMVELLKAIGASVSASPDGHLLHVDGQKVNTGVLPPDLVRKERATSVLVGPLLTRFGSVSFPHPGGDVIGERPLDLLTDGLAAMGAEVTLGDRQYEITAKRLRGATYVFRRVSVTVTENLMLAAVLADGRTTLINAAMEPEVVALAEFLNEHGAHITGAGSPTITIEGVKALHPNGHKVTVMPDRVETATFACLAAAADGDVRITHCEPAHVEVFLKVLADVGVPVVREADSLHVTPHGGKLRATNVITHEHPGFATDFQSPITVLLTQAHGTSLIHETVYEGRLFYTDKLKQMGANVIMADPHRVILTGPSQLRGRKIVSPDIRAGVALVIAGLIAEGETKIGNIYQIERGYERIDERLQALGASIKRHETATF